MCPHLGLPAASGDTEMWSYFTHRGHKGENVKLQPGLEGRAARSSIAAAVETPALLPGCLPEKKRVEI